MTEKYEEMIIRAADSWLSKNCMGVNLYQDTEEGQRLNDAWNDWYNDSVLLPVNQAVYEALTNDGYDELSIGDICDICDSILFKNQLIIQLMQHCYYTGLRVAEADK